MLLGVCWAHVGSMLGRVGPMLGHLGPMLCPCWAYIGSMVNHIGRSLQKTWKNTGFSSNKAPPQAKA